MRSWLFIALFTVGVQLITGLGPEAWQLTPARIAGLLLLAIWVGILSAEIFD